MRHVKPVESFRRKALIFGVILVVFVTILGMYYASAGLALCSKSSNVLISAPIVLWSKPILPFAHATDIAGFLEKNRAKVGVELGVQAGAFAEKMLTQWKSCERYYLVDVWKSQPNYRDFANVGDAAQERIFQKAKKALARFAKKTTFLRIDTRKFAQNITQPLDFIYIDARRDYCAVKADIQAYWPKLRTGGIMAGGAYAVEGPAGSDWSVCQDGSKHEGAVKAAVDEFVLANNLHMSVTYKDTPYPTWIIRKPPQPQENQPPQPPSKA